MPYHALATAHKRLMAGLPADSPYRRTEARSLREVIATLWRRAKASEQPRCWNLESGGDSVGAGA
jgi:hypothetical protein